MFKEFVLMSFCLKKSFVALGVTDEHVIGGEVPVHSEASVIGVRSTDLLGLGEAEVGVAPVGQAEGFVVKMISI